MSRNDIEWFELIGDNGSEPTAVLLPLCPCRDSGHHHIHNDGVTIEFEEQDDDDGDDFEEDEDIGGLEQ